MPQQLVYAGTDEPVAVGDRVCFSTLLLKRRRLGRVIHIPKSSAVELEKSGRDPEFWLVELDSGEVYEIVYAPEEAQPPKRLRLIARAESPGQSLSPGQVAELLDPPLQETTWLDLVKLVGALVAACLLVAWLVL